MKKVIINLSFAFALEIDVENGNDTPMQPFEITDEIKGVSDYIRMTVREKMLNDSIYATKIVEVN